MKFPGVLKKEHVGITGSIKKEVEFCGDDKCGISMSLVFWPWNFQV